MAKSSERKQTKMMSVTKSEKCCSLAALAQSLAIIVLVLEIMINIITIDHVTSIWQNEINSKK